MLFTSGLAGPIDSQRCGLVRRLVGSALGAIEHKIGRHLQEPCAARARPLGDDPRGFGVDGIGKFWLRFGPIYRGIGARIDNDCRLPLLQGVPNLCRLREIGSIAGNGLEGDICRTGALQLAPELSRRTEETDANHPTALVI